MSMKKHRDNFKIVTRGNEEKSSQRSRGFERYNSNLIQSKGKGPDTAYKILLYMQEEKKFWSKFYDSF